MQFNTLKRIQDAIVCIRSGKLDELPCGRHELFDGMYVTISQYQTKETGPFEAHRKYIDVQYLISGTECIEVADVQTLQVTQEYNAEKDCVLGSAEGKAYVLTQGQFMVLFPEEAHRPGMKSGDITEVKKAVIKVPV